MNGLATGVDMPVLDTLIQVFGVLLATLGLAHICLLITVLTLLCKKIGENAVQALSAIHLIVGDIRIG
jgi:hypothetical protein